MRQKPHRRAPDTRRCTCGDDLGWAEGPLPVRHAPSIASAKALPPVAVRFGPGCGYHATPEPCSRFGAVAVPWFSAQENRMEVVATGTGKAPSRDGASHPAASTDAARSTGEAVSDAQGRSTGTGPFGTPGHSTAVVGATVRRIGFGDPIATVGWQPFAVTDDVVPERGWATTIEGETTPDDTDSRKTVRGRPGLADPTAS